MLKSHLESNGVHFRRIFLNLHRRDAEFYETIFMMREGILFFIFLFRF